MHKSDLAVVICSFNTKNITDKCLGCLSKGDKKLEIIVVENGSDGTAEMIKIKYPRVKLIDRGKILVLPGGII